MGGSDEKIRQMQERFVASLFRSEEEPGKLRGMLASVKGNATPSDIATFAQRQEVFDASNRFLGEIHTMWNQWKGENVASGSLQPSAPPARSSDSQMQESGVENPMNDDKNSKPDTTIQTADQVPPVPPPESPSSSATPAAMQGNPDSPGTAAVIDHSKTVAATVTPALTTKPAASASQPAGSATVNPSAKPGQIPPGGSPAGKASAPKATFQIPNAKVGVPYVGKIEGFDQNRKMVRVRELRVPPELGLSFDEASGEIKGVPLTDGEQRISLQWSSDGSSWFSGECMIFINPDPRSLWKNIDPPANDPYFKPNIVSATVKAPEYSIIAASRRGRSHEHSGTFRDDDFFVNHNPVENWNVMIVADGAGSAKNSRQGSKLAVEAFGKHLKEQLANDLGCELAAVLAGWSAEPKKAAQSLGEKFHYLFHKAGTLAIQAIESEAQAKNLPVKEYSTTLLAAVARLDGDSIFLSTFWMGDGAIVAYGPRGKVRLMGTPDGGEFAGQTRFLDRTALADAGFAKRIGIGRYSEISALMLMTDGVSDPRFETDAGLADPALWDQLWDELLPLVKSENPDKKLVDWLHFFTPGHHDDRTIAMLVL